MSVDRLYIKPGSKGGLKITKKDKSSNIKRLRPKRVKSWEALEECHIKFLEDEDEMR
jgi:hypothetical protein